MKAYLKIVDGINQIFKVLVIVMLVLLSLVVLAQIITRSLHISVAWLEEMARYSMIYVCFLGSAVCCSRGTLIKVDVLYEILSEKTRKTLLVIVGMLSIAFLFFALYSCAQYLPLGFNSDAASMRGVRMFWFYLAMPIGLGMMLLNTIANLIEILKGGNKT